MRRIGATSYYTRIVVASKKFVLKKNDLGNTKAEATADMSSDIMEWFVASDVSFAVASGVAG